MEECRKQCRCHLSYRKKVHGNASSIALLRAISARNNYTVRNATWKTVEFLRDGFSTLKNAYLSINSTKVSLFARKYLKHTRCYSRTLKFVNFYVTCRRDSPHSINLNFRNSWIRIFYNSTDLRYDALLLQFAIPSVVNPVYVATNLGFHKPRFDKLSNPHRF